MTDLLEHLKSGQTTVCRCWDVTRADGVRLGFTDHDGDLVFDGLTYRAGTGLTAKALMQTTGLSVDNTEAMGALSSEAIHEADIAAGRYDGAAVVAWLVNWADPAQRLVRFRGTLGEVRRGGGAFHAELRGQTERLNQPIGRIYQRSCGGTCIDHAAPGNFADATVAAVTGAQVFRFDGLGAYPDRWFERGTLQVQGGAAQGLAGLIKRDATEAGQRVLTLWQPLGAAVAPGDGVRLLSGGDGTAEHHRDRFGDLADFRGFPHIPGEDWLIRAPKPAGRS